MGTRRALLIGIGEYGEGFRNLPVVRHDVSLMDKALRDCGYEVEAVTEDGLDAELLGTKLRSFCEDCEAGDVHLIYFSGHGLAVGGRDFIVPPGVRLEDASENDHCRIPTNLSKYVEAGLVVFVVDACRDAEPTTKAGREGFGYETAGGPQFVRFFGCSRGEKCQVVQQEDGSKNFSMFTKSLADSLLERESDSLREVSNRVTELCRDSAVGNLQAQKPHLSHGETTPETDMALNQRIFNAPVCSTVWTRFEPHKMHCITITSELESRDNPTWTLDGLVGDTMTGRLGRKVWSAFRTYAHDRVSLRKERRELAATLSQDSIQLAAVNVRDAFEEEVFDQVVRGVVEADLAIFDVSGFEPGMMLLMGIRSACRRGISIATVGGGWRELDEIDIPFNLRDLSLGSHTESAGGTGIDYVADKFVKRIEFGFRQMTQQPGYQDLPAYHALRQLGPTYEASSTISRNEYVLILSSYEESYKENWRFLSNSLAGCLSDFDNTKKAKVKRLIDLGNPQLVSQSLYEQIRRTESCVADWTRFSPSTFFELGVRLAVSEYGAVQIVDRRYLPEGEKSKKWKSMSRQIRSMSNLFSPLTYEPRREEEKNIKEAAKMLSARKMRGRRSADQADDYDRVSKLVSETMNAVTESNPPVFRQLEDAADALHHPKHGEKGAPQILFRNSPRQLTQLESERAAMELRIAAWLYMHYRHKAGELDLGHPDRLQYDKLSLDTSNSLFDAGEVEFGDLIAGGGQFSDEEKNK